MSDHDWEQALAATTPEQWEKLENVFREDEARGTYSLDVVLDLSKLPRRCPRVDVTAGPQEEFEE